MSSRFADASMARLVGVIDGAELRAQDVDLANTVAEIALAVVDSGVALVLYRDPELDVVDMVPIAREIRSAIEPGYSKARLLIEDRIGVAIAAGADGVFVADPSVDIADVHRTMGPEAWSGVTICAEESQPASSVADDADLVIVCGPRQIPLAGNIAELVAQARAFAPTAHILAFVDNETAAEKAVSAGADGIACPATWLIGSESRQLIAGLLSRYGETASVGPDNGGRSVFSPAPAEAR